MLTQWLPETENKLPPNASHQVGVGAFVFDRASGRVLVVQERSGPLKGKGVWKIPTGLVQQGEDITEAAVREVHEETGVRTRYAPQRSRVLGRLCNSFESDWQLWPCRVSFTMLEQLFCRFKAVLAMRQAHGLAFGKSDMFFVVALEPEGWAEQQELVIQEDEIEAATWLPLQEYATSPFTQSRPLLKKIMERCVAYAKGRYSGLEGSKLASGFTEREDLLLFGESSGEGVGEAPGSQEDAWIGLS